MTMHGALSKKLHRELSDIKHRGGIVITTYGMLVSQQQLMSEQPSGMKVEFVWDVAVFDEANKVKNPATKVATAAFELSAGMKLLLTGTPIQVLCLCARGDKNNCSR